MAITGVLLVLLIPQTAARDAPEPVGFQLIVHPSVEVRSLSRARVAEIFLKKHVRWSDGTRILPVDHPVRSPLRARFLKAVYDKEPRYMSRYWQRRIFSGRGVPPPEVASDEKVIAYVARNRGAIGYITAGPVPSSVKALEMTR